MNAHAPLGSSSGLIQAIESIKPVRAGKRDWYAPFTGLVGSIVLHSGIVLLGIALMQQVPKLMETPAQTSVPTMSLLESPSLSNLPSNASLNALNSSKKDTFAGQASALGSETGIPFAGTSATFNNALTSNANESTAIASGTATPLSGVSSTIGKDGQPLGRPDGVAGEKINFLPPGATPGGPTASRVVFVCDATGTMTGLKFDLLKRELGTTIGKFKPTTNFNVVFYADAQAKGISNALLPATPQNKKKAGDFLATFAPRGATNPLPGLEQAFSMKPEVIFLLSDGEFDNLVAYDEVVGAVAKLNSKRNVRVYTILFGDRDARAEETLKKIATDNGGTFRFVATDQLLAR